MGNEDGIDLGIGARLGACAGTVFVCTACDETFQHQRDAQFHALRAHGDVMTVQLQDGDSD